MIRLGTGSWLGNDMSMKMGRGGCEGLGMWIKEIWQYAHASHQFLAFLFIRLSHMFSSST